MFRFNKRNDALDVIRGLAAIGVVTFHLPYVAQAKFALPFDQKVYHLANGVPLFFVLSGYLLTVLMPHNERHASPVTSFYIKRFFRIAPLFYAVTALTILRTVWLGGGFPKAAALAADVSLLFNLIPRYVHSLVFAGWTIGVEILFYLLFPIIYRATRTLAGLIITFTASVLVREAFVAFIQFAAGAVLVESHTGAFVDRHWRELAAGALMFGLVLCLPTRGLGPIAFVGRVSYSTYLLHGLVILSMTPFYASIIALGLSPGPTILMGLGATFAVLLPLSYLTYLLVEQPGINFGMRQIERLHRHQTYCPPVAVAPAVPSGR